MRGTHGPAILTLAGLVYRIDQVAEDAHRLTGEMGDRHLDVTINTRSASDWVGRSLERKRRVGHGDSRPNARAGPWGSDQRPA